MDAGVCWSSLLWAGPLLPLPRASRGQGPLRPPCPPWCRRRSREGHREKNGKTVGRCQLGGPVSLEKEKFRRKPGKVWL